MFNLHHITITNFRSYRGTHEFEFPVANGLYFLAGKNEANQALGANGAGKSTFLDAITWALFGRTTRGLKASEVVSWGCASAAVTLELTVGDQKIQVQRTQKPNGLFLNTKPVDQTELEKTIRLNYDGFKYSILNPQFTESFFSLSPSNKLSLFSDIQNLDFWLEKSDEASKLVKKLEALMSEQTTRISYLDGQQVSIRSDIISLKNDEQTYDNNRDDEAKHLKSQVKEIWNEKKRLEKDVDEKLIPNKETLIKQIELLQTKCNNFEISRDNYLDAMDDAFKSKTEYLTTKKSLVKHKGTLETHPTTCPTCFQSVSTKHMANKVMEINKEISYLDKELIRLELIIAELNQKMIKTKIELSSAESDFRYKKSELAKIETKISSKESDIRNINPRLDSIATQLAKLTSEENPYGKMLVAKREQLIEIKKWLTEANDKFHELEKKHVAASYWIKGFKRVRLFIIEQAFQTLEVEVNNSLAQLGMTDWQITFDIERENKAGGITKGFVVFIKGPSNTEPVKWENWSGGETQRLQLAGDLGLANLIMQSAGLRSTIEFFDEPSTHLSAEGMMDLADMLHERAVNENKRIWIADHTSITNFGEFEGIITARKDKNGSSITYNDT